MARVCLLAFLTGFLLRTYGMETEIPEQNKEIMFISQQAANAVLHRQRRFNSGRFEELQKDNLERECYEEQCTMEEAREWFENDDQTIEFWAGYVDGDQCKPPPCQNGGQCKDGVNSYICWCKPNFSGKNCETDLTLRCIVNNGGCAHFCRMQRQQIVCHCAAGYTLGTDRKSCEPAAKFSCGRANVGPSDVSTSSTPTPFLKPRSIHRDVMENSTLDYEDEYFNYDDLDSLDNASSDSTFNVSSASWGPSEAVTHHIERRSIRSIPGNTSWPSPTRPPLKATKNSKHRIVGGSVASPGEIPWQVALMYHDTVLNKSLPFCGGSLLSEFWVITAAHCVVEAKSLIRNYFIRVGEHDLNVHEGTERDHTVAEEHIYPSYDNSVSQFDQDVALLKLSSPVELSTERRPICVGPKDFIQKLLRESSTSLVSGWGRLRFQGAQATKLQRVSLPRVDRTLCKHSSNDRITRFMFCAGYPNGTKDSCQGDSGGPHATNFKGTWFLTGIVSWGERCAEKGRYGIYTRISRYYAWISQTTGIRVST